MAMYTVTTTQMLVATLFSAMISAGSVVGYQQYREKQDLPQVHVTDTGNCVKVMNYRNGDAYNCEDVDVVLRSYRRVAVPTPSVQNDGAPITASKAPVVPDK